MVQNKLYKKPIAVLGGGVTAQTFAFELSYEGYKVRLYEHPKFAAASLGKVLTTKEIKLSGVQLGFKWFKREGAAKIDVVTTDMKEAVKDAGLIVVALPAKGHKPFFENLIPCLEDGQVVSIFPDNFGSLLLRKMMSDKGCRADVVIGGWSSMPYGVRFREPGDLDLILRPWSIMGDALPSTDREKFFAAHEGFPPFDGITYVKEGDTVIAVGLSNPNPVTHVCGSLLSVGPMEVSETEGTLGIPKGKFSMYKYGMSAPVARVQLGYHREEGKIAEAMGIKMHQYRDDQFFWKGGIMGLEFWVPFADVVLPPIVGPDTVEHRYFTEDIPVGTVVRSLLAKKFGVSTPIIDGTIALGSAACNHDFLAEGLSLEDLGLADLNKQQIMSYVKEGAFPRNK